MINKMVAILLTTFFGILILFSIKLLINFIFEPKLKFISGIQDDGIYYCLYRDSGIDIKWLIYKYPSNCPSLSSYGDIDDNKNLLFYSWDDGIISKDANIDIYDGFLVFERDGLFQSLYDINNDEVLLNYKDVEFEVKNELGKSYTDKQLREWKVENIHNKILQIINE